MLQSTNFNSSFESDFMMNCRVKEQVPVAVAVPPPTLLVPEPKRKGNRNHLKGVEPGVGREKRILFPLDTSIRCKSRGPITPDHSSSIASFFKGNSLSQSPSSPRLFYRGTGGGCNSPLPFLMDEDMGGPAAPIASQEECLESACNELMEILAAPTPLSPPSSSFMRIERHHLNFNKV